MEEKIKNLKEFGIIVVVLSFVVIPLVSYLCVVKILPDIYEGSASSLQDILSFFYILVVFVYTFLWIRLFNKLS